MCRERRDFIHFDHLQTVKICHHLYPVHMYNAPKPQQFRVDFFLFSVTEVDKYNIMHLDIYQSVHSHNIDIEPEAQCVGTTSKAVLNTVCQVDIANATRGSKQQEIDSKLLWFRRIKHAHWF